MRDPAATTPLRLVVVGLSMLVIIATGCSRLAGSQQVHNLTWSRIPLPAGVEASSLAVTTAGLLVEGRASSGGDHPVLFVVDASGAVRPVPLHPNSPSGHADGVVALWIFDTTATPATGIRDSTLPRLQHDADDARTDHRHIR
jgi:hypothetical protein